MTLELRSPRHDRASLHLPQAASALASPYNGSISSEKGDEYTIENNILDLLSKPQSLSMAQRTNHWQLTASAYEDLWRKRSLSLLTGEPFPFEKEKALLARWAAPSSGEWFLDVGCSSALYARFLKQAEPGVQVAAVDVSHPMLREARSRAAAENTPLYLVRADARELPFFNGTFDGVVMGGTLNELSDPQKVMYECRRVIKKGGRFFMMHLLRADSWPGRLLQKAAEAGGIHFPTLAESNALFARSGFATEEQARHGIVCFSRLRAE
ncbi:MAG: class I SAM-dependent methyltransferase [Balneolaceae bacterium]